MRFMRLEDVADELNVNLPQVRSLVRSGDLPAIKIGGRGVWRVERSELEAYIQRQYTLHGNPSRQVPSSRNPPNRHLASPYFVHGVLWV